MMVLDTDVNQTISQLLDEAIQRGTTKNGKNALKAITVLKPSQKQANQTAKKAKKGGFKTTNTYKFYGKGYALD